jgi:ankyrin repeat protein
MALAADDLSAALGSHINIYCPNAKVSRLLLLSGASANYISSCLQNAPLLQVFAHEGFEEMVSLLIEFGANVNGQNAEGTTPLMSACQVSFTPILQVLYFWIIFDGELSIFGSRLFHYQ